MPGHLWDLPWCTDGLSLTERLCLAAVAGGARTLGEIFCSAQAADDALGFGDIQLLLALRALTQRGMLTENKGGWAPTGSGGGRKPDTPTWCWDPERGRVMRYERTPTGWGVDDVADRA